MKPPSSSLHNNKEKPVVNKLLNPITMRSKILSHTRSSSMPSRSYNSITPEFSLYLNTINSDNNPTSSSSLSLISKKLHTIESLYDCVDNLLLLPHTHQIFARESHEKWVDEILEGYLGLVDACATAKDFVSHSKEHILNLLSILRRKRASDDLSEFFSSRKSIKKQIQRSVREIRILKNNKSSVSPMNVKDQETIAIISMLKKTESITLDLLEALLLSISCTKGNARPSGWSLVSKLIRSGKNSCQHEKCPIFELGDLEAALCKFICLRPSKGGSEIRVGELQQQLREMDSIVREIEERLEWLFKRLIKSRVSLLNMQSQNF